MMVPIRDILAAQPCKAFQFSCYGLLVVIKGYEELFFEFGSQERRNFSKELIEQQVDECRRHSFKPGRDALTAAEREAMILEELEPSDLASEEEPTPPSETLVESLPAVMFTSTSSTFLSFRPQGSLHFTFLTIGS
jgi:sterol 3beta-glucosyltransferase